MLIFLKKHSDLLAGSQHGNVQFVLYPVREILNDFSNQFITQINHFEHTSSRRAFGSLNIHKFSHEFLSLHPGEAKIS